MTPLPTLDLLSRLTDRAVIDQLIETPLLTRADIAALTGLSKPTVSESMRRLGASGLVVEAGQASSGRGRAGVNFALAPDAGRAVAIDAGPDGVRARTFDLTGAVIREFRQVLPAQVGPDALGDALVRVARSAVAQGEGPLRATSLSVADPVERTTGRVVHLPDSPFLVGELDAREVLAGLELGALEVDNDVNWSAVAEQSDGVVAGVSDFVHCYLGAGIGGAFVIDGLVRRGARGLAGEFQQVPVAVDGERNLRLVECFSAWGLTRAGSAAIDVEVLRAVLIGRTAADRDVTDRVVAALTQVLASATALVNPEVIVLGGPWSDAGDLSGRLTRALAAAAVPARVVMATVDDPAFAGAGRDALDRARKSLVMVGDS